MALKHQTQFSSTIGSWYQHSRLLPVLPWASLTSLPLSRPPYPPTSYLPPPLFSLPSSRCSLSVLKSQSQLPVEECSPKPTISLQAAGLGSLSSQTSRKLLACILQTRQNPSPIPAAEWQPSLACFLLTSSECYMPLLRFIPLWNEHIESLNTFERVTHAKY